MICLSRHPIFTFFLCASFFAGFWLPEAHSQANASDSTLHAQEIFHATSSGTANSNGSNTLVHGNTSAGISLVPADSLTYEEKLAVIESNDLYPPDMVTFAQKYPQTIDYVYNYPQHLSQASSSTKYSSEDFLETDAANGRLAEDAAQQPLPATTNEAISIDLSVEASTPGVPLLLQWDTRWGYRSYGSGLIGYTGCGPTCLSMAAISLTHNARYSPAYVADLAANYGYVVPGSGSSWSLISEGCALLGLSARQLSLKEDQMKQALDNHCPIIAVVGPGDFTYSGHFIVITGYTAQGFTVNDPNSPENSEKYWNFGQLKGQIKNLWAMSAQ